ncbi:MAG: two-partner secretion domain-containing protein [Betaproteobacteria bacterium]
MKKSRARLGQLTIIAASIQLIYAGLPPAYANPTGPQVVNGAATFHRPDSRSLSITNAPGTIINWQGFSIGSGELTRFIQQSPSSSVLNRVVGPDISQIHGQLLSNGRVFLINPSGIVIGPGAMVDTAGFVASTLNMLDGDFLAGKLKFQGDSASGSIINQGWIRTGYGGHVLLVAPQIENSGLIHAPGGEILLAAGKKLTVTSLDLDGVQFEVQAPTDSVLNVGKLLADGGAVGVFAGSLRHSGEIRANALVYDQAGRIVLKAQNEIQIVAGSTTSADGKIGGDITVQSGALTRVAGSVSAQGSAGQGGDIRLLGDRVAVVESGSANASGATAGGQILVGGDFQGSNAAIPNATDTFVGSGATLRADATQSGDGGRIIVWSDDKAQFYGTLSARGGPEGGNGGFAEVSGKQNLVFAGSADLGAAKGTLGDLLLDPLDLYVFSSGGNTYDSVNDVAEFPSHAATVSPATLAAVTGNITLNAARYMRIGDAITLTTSGQSLTATVSTYSAPASPDPLNLSDSVSNRLDIGADITTAGGAVSLTAPTISSVASSTIATAGGAISLSTSGSTISASSLSLNAGSGAISATSGSSIQLDDVTGGSFTASGPSSIDIFGAITTSGGLVSLTSTGSYARMWGGAATSGGRVEASGASFVQNFGTIAAGAGNVALSGTSVTGGAIDTSGTVMLTASQGSVSATVDNAASVTASATNSTGSASVTLSSATVLNATDVRATTTHCNSFSGACSGATITLDGDLGVNLGTIVATAPTNFVNQVTYGSAYADTRFESINERVTVNADNGSIRAMSSSSSITAADVSLITGQLSGGGIGQLGATPLAVKVDVERTFTFRPNGEFNVELTGAGPNNLAMEIGVAPAAGPAYTGTLSKSGQITLNVSGTSDTVTASTFHVTGGFDQRVLNNSPGISLIVPNGKLTANDVMVPAGDQTGASSPGARFNCDVFGGTSCPASIIIEPLSVTLKSDQALQVDNYTRATGAVAKQTTLRSDNAAVTLGAIAGHRDGLTIFGRGDISITNLSTMGFTSVSSSPTSGTGNISITSLDSDAGVSASASNGNITVGFIDTLGGSGAVTLTANAGTIQAAANASAVEIQSAGAVTASANTIASTATNPLDIIGASVSLTSGTGGAIGSAGTPVVARTTALTINAAANFHVDTGTVDIRNLTVTANPVAVGSNGLARVVSNAQTYDFVSNGTAFTLGGSNFAGGGIPSAQFATGGKLDFTATSGNLTLNAIDMSGSNGSFSATTLGNLANITQTAGQGINLGTGVLTAKADGNVTLESVTAGGLNVTNATTIVGSGCNISSSGPCGVTSFTANQTLTGTGTWNVDSRGAITTGALQVANIDFTTNAGGNITTGAIGTAGTPVSSATLATTAGSGGNVQVNGAIEADALTVNARGNVIIGTGSLPTDQANLIINASNTDAASIGLTSQSGTITVNGALNASSVTLTSPTAISTGNINPTAVSPASITFNSTSAVDISTGSLDATTIRAQSACSSFYCPPDDIIVNGAIGGNVPGTTLFLDGWNGTTLSIAGAVTLNSSGTTSLFLQSSGDITLGSTVSTGTDSNFRILASSNLTGASGGALSAITAGNGSNITLQASGTDTTPLRFTRIDAGATGSVTVTAPAGIAQTTSGASDGITARTVTLRATEAGSAIEGPSSTTPAPLVLRETSSLAIDTAGSVRVLRTGASGVPVLSNLDITRSDSTAVFDLTGYAASQAVTVTNVSGGVEVAVSNTSSTPLNFTYRNTDAAADGSITGTGITTAGGTVTLDASGTLTTGAIDSRSGVTTPPDGAINLTGGALIDVSGTVNSGTRSISASADAVSGSGQLVSTSSSSVSVTAGSGNIGSSTTPLSISAPRVTLSASGSTPSGNVFASLTGTNNLTLDADDGFTVTSSVPISTLNLTTSSSGVGLVSLATDSTQSFGFQRNGTTFEITGVTSTPPLSTFDLTTSGNLRVKGGIAASALELTASGGTLTLDGSSSALVLSNASQSLWGSTAVNILGDVTASTTGNQSIQGSGTLSFTGTGSLSSGASQTIDMSGNIAITTVGGPISITGSTQYIRSFGNLDFTATGGAITVTGASQQVIGDSFNSVMTLQGGGAAGQAVTFTASGSQTIQTDDNANSAIRLLGGGGTDASASILYTGTGEQTVQGGDVILTAGTAAGASALISTATGSQLVRSNRDIKLTADAAEAKIVTTSGQAQQIGESRCTPVSFGCIAQPYQTDSIILQGGTGFEAALLSAGSQTVHADVGIQVLGGSGAGGKARIETTSTTQEQRIGCGASGSGEICTTNLNTLTLTAGANGAFAEITTPGVQRMFGTSTLTMTGSFDNGGYAGISSGGTHQNIRFGNTTLTAGEGDGSHAEILYTGTGVAFQDSQVLRFSNLTLTAGGDSGGNTAVARISSSDTRTDEDAQQLTASGVVQLIGGAGPDSVAQITTSGRQNLSLGTVTLKGGTGSSSFARINTPASQTISFSSLTLDNSALTTGSGAYAKVDAGSTQQLFGGGLTLTAGGVGETTIANAGATIEGHSQYIQVSSLNLLGGSGTSGATSDAYIKNLSGSQTVTAFGNIAIQGGHQHSTTGILNAGTGAQTVSASGAIALTSDTVTPPAHADSLVLIQNSPATAQTITASGGGLRLTNSGSGTLEVTSAGSQKVTARYVDVQTSAGSSGNATLSTTGTQYIRTTNENVNEESLIVAAFGSGTAKIEAGTSQLLEVGYPLIMQGSSSGSGLLSIGSANGVDAAGNSLVLATDQTVFAGSILVQGPTGSGALSKLSATNAQNVSTLLGGIDVLGGTGADSLATVDPLVQVLLVNGPISLLGGQGPGTNADASIVSGGSQTILGTSGGITLTGGQTTGSDALISNLGAQQGCSLISFSCGQTQTITPTPTLSQMVGSAFTAGGIASNSTGAGAIISADATQQTLANQDEFGSAFDTLAPDSEDPMFGRRAPICR